MVINIRINMRVMIEGFMTFTTYTLNNIPSRFSYKASLSKSLSYIQKISASMRIALPSLFKDDSDFKIDYRTNKSSKKLSFRLLNLSSSSMDLRFFFLLLNENSWFSFNNGGLGYLSISKAVYINDYNEEFLNKISDNILSVFDENYQLEKAEGERFLDDLKNTLFKGLGLPMGLLSSTSISRYGTTPKRFGSDEVICDIEGTTTDSTSNVMNSTLNVKLEKELRNTVLKGLGKL